MLSEKEGILLTLLSPISREHTGFDLADASNGKIARGSVHVYLSRLIDMGYVTKRKEEASVSKYPRTFYRLTEEGRKARIEHTSAESRGRWVLAWH